MSMKKEAYLVDLIVVQVQAIGDVLPTDGMVHVRADTAGCNNVASDFLVAEVCMWRSEDEQQAEFADRLTNGHTASERLNRALAARVHGMFWHTLGLTRDTSHEDNPATNFKILVRLASNEELTTSIDTEDAVKFLGCHVLHMSERNNAGVGADDVELAESLLRFLEHGDDLWYI